jgi:plastocyanin
MDRRKLLRSLAAGLTVAVAGCGGDGGTPSDSPASSPAPAETTPTPTPSQTNPETQTPASETATSTPEPTPEPTAEPPTEPTQTPESTQTPEPTPTPTPVAQTVEVGAGDGFEFAPGSFSIAAGEAVEWVWVGSNHNVTAESVPSGSDWTGTPGAPDRLFDSGHSYRDTFDEPGEYAYYCAPHRSAGMTGSFTVTE